MKKFAFLSLLLATLFACTNQEQASNDKSSSQEEQANKETAQETRIVSLNGTLTEIICGLGLQNQIAGVDVTSTYPPSLEKLPKVGHSMNLSAEGILSLNPTMVLGIEGEIKPSLVEQFKNSGITFKLFPHEKTVAGSKKLIEEVGTYFEAQNKANSLVDQLETGLDKLTPVKDSAKVLFIYARGPGTLMVAGENTPVEHIIALAGGKNAGQGFEGFKPLTPEALVVQNPDAFLLFSSGLESLGGIEGLLKIPGVAETEAGKNQVVIEMDGQLLTGFSPRLGEAVSNLNKELCKL